VHPGVSRLWLKANASLTSGAMNDHLPSGVLRFWFGAGEEYGRRHKRWFEKDASFDAEVSRRFLPLYEKLAAGAGREWLESRGDPANRGRASLRAATPRRHPALRALSSPQRGARPRQHARRDRIPETARIALLIRHSRQ